MGTMLQRLMTQQAQLRWGILGSANIARKNWKAIWNSQNGRVSAVASRNPGKSRQFIESCQAHAPFEPTPRALGSYEELLAARDVDAVYIPLPTGVRAEWVKKAAAAGKHVVCEKPCATSSAELQEMLDACRNHGVQFLDGVMFMHSRRLEKMREVLDDGKTIGPVRRITSAFSFFGGEEFLATNIRARSEMEPFGCLGDLGWYCIRFALWTMKWELPHTVYARALSERKHPESASPVPIDFSAELHFNDEVTSGFFCSFRVETEQWAMVSGERGQVWVPDFVLPFSGNRIAFQTSNPTFSVKGCDFEMQPNSRRWEVEETSHSQTDSQETNLFRSFAAQVGSGTMEPRWPEIALKTQQVMEACFKSAAAGGQPVQLQAEPA